MQLERRDDIFCGLVQHACLRAVVADPRQLLLDPAYGGQAGALEILCISGRQVGPIPPSYALRGQFSPRKQRAGVDFPLWRDVAVPDNVGGLYLVAFDNVFEQGGDDPYLRGWIRRPGSAFAARIDD